MRRVSFSRAIPICTFPRMTQPEFIFTDLTNKRATPRMVEKEKKIVKIQRRYTIPNVLTLLRKRQKNGRGGGFLWE